MNVSYRKEDRRSDLRSAALHVIDEERSELGYQVGVKGSTSISDVISTFDEVLASFPLEDEVGHALSSAEEVRAWARVLHAMKPVWALWPKFANTEPEAITATPEWDELRRVVADLVETQELWFEEIEYPVIVQAEDGEVMAGSRDELEALVSEWQSAPPRVADRAGRVLELLPGPPVALLRVSLPQ